MALCSACFKNGNHIGHDFNMFRSKGGGSCDCGNPGIMSDLGYCSNHGPGKLKDQREPPDNLIRRLKLLIPLFLRSVLFASWSIGSSMDNYDSEEFKTACGCLMATVSFINELLTCGWVAQKIIAEIMNDRKLFCDFIFESKNTDQFEDWQLSILTDPYFTLPMDKIGSQSLHHQTFMDAFLFVCIKLQFPESLVTVLIGMLTIETYGNAFVHSYLDHYSRITAALLFQSQGLRYVEDSSLNLNSKVTIISIQLFSSEVTVSRMIKERNLHYLIIHCLINLLETALTRLDTNDNQVINCESSIIKNRAFWPVVSDLTNMVAHKSAVDLFTFDTEFLGAWVKVLRWMQFMNFFVLEDGIHTEFDSMSYFYSFNMEIEISTSLMWNIWSHYRSEKDKETALQLVHHFITSLAEFIENLGAFKVVLIHDHSRKPLSFHLPLMRTTTCFLLLAVIYHDFPLSGLLANMSMPQLIRWFNETINILFASQEIRIGYWLRNQGDVRNSNYYYTLNKFSYGLIDMDILASQICASVIPSSTVIYSLTDPTQLLKGIHFTVPKNVYQAHGKFQIDDVKLDAEKQPQALEAWFMNICWLLDLRNQMSFDAVTELRKEISCHLCSESIKRSVLKDRLPRRFGINVPRNYDIDSILSEIADFTEPTYNEVSKHLKCGTYSLKPELWDREYDPAFQSLRSSSRRDCARTLSKYQEYYRQTKQVTRPFNLWPPYRIPAPLPCALSRLENLLHCKDLTYIFFCSLCMFLDNGLLVTEDSLALIIHLIHRSMIIDEPDQDEDDVSEFHKTRFPDNPYKVNNMRINIRFNIDVYSQVNGTNKCHGTAQELQGESILSLLLKTYSKLSLMRMELESQSTVTSDSYLCGHNCHSDYHYCTGSLQRAHETGLGINWGDGVDFVGHLLDLIVSQNDENSSYLLACIQDSRPRDVAHLKMVHEKKDPSDHHPGKESVISSKDFNERKQQANDRRQKVMLNMVLKQKAFAAAHQHDSLDVIVSDETTEMFECVICQQKSDPRQDKMVMLGMICCDGLIMYMKDMIRTSGGVAVALVHRKDFVGNVPGNGPLLSRGIIIQMCGHVVHHSCFDNYRKHKRWQGSIPCPLCRREVHHLTPIHIQDPITNPSNGAFYPVLKAQLLRSLETQFCDIKTDIIDPVISNKDIVEISIEHQACSLLRSQLELELIVCLSYPNQLSTVTKRCQWPQFISYLRTLNVSISILIGQSDALFGTTFSDELCPDNGGHNKLKSNMFLLEVPSDVFLNLVPYIWPCEVQFSHTLQACIVMAYVKGMVTIAGRLSQWEYDCWSRAHPDSYVFDEQFSRIFRKCNRMYCHKNVNFLHREMSSTDMTTIDHVSIDLMKFLLPLLRIAAVLRIHFLKLLEVPDNFPLDNAKLQDYGHQFDRLCEFLNLTQRRSCSQTLPERLVDLLSMCLKSTLYHDLDQFINKHLSDEFIDRCIQENNAARLSNQSLDILNLGNELYPPHLIRLPDHYEDLFNRYHSAVCDATSKDCCHAMKENGLCMICGSLVCFVCQRITQAFHNHTKTCCFGIGVILEVNSSAIFILVNNEVSQWGSVYLDSYGEEDLDLKRGRPLFLNSHRLDLLQQQWLTHSFKNVINNWKRIS